MKNQPNNTQRKAVENSMEILIGKKAEELKDEYWKRIDSLKPSWYFSEHTGTLTGKPPKEVSQAKQKIANLRKKQDEISKQIKEQQNIIDPLFEKEQEKTNSTKRALETELQQKHKELLDLQEELRLKIWSTDSSLESILDAIKDDN